MRLRIRTSCGWWRVSSRGAPTTPPGASTAPRTGCSSTPSRARAASAGPQETFTPLRETPCCCGRTCGTTTALPTHTWSLAYAHFHPAGGVVAAAGLARQRGGVGVLHAPGEVRPRVLGGAAFLRARVGRLSRAVRTVRGECARVGPAVARHPEPAPGSHGREASPGHGAHRRRPRRRPRQSSALARIATLSVSRLTHLFTATLGIPPQALRRARTADPRSAAARLDRQSGGRDRAGCRVGRPAVLLAALRAPARAQSDGVPAPSDDSPCTRVIRSASASPRGSTSGAAARA